MKKLHIVVRSDLPIAQQCVQSVHAMRQFTEEHPHDDRDWFKNSNTIAILAVESEKVLAELLESARLQRIPASGFREPDRDNELTAAAIGPAGKRLCRRLPLALAEDGACASSTPCTSTIDVKTSTEPSTTTVVDSLLPAP